MSSEGTGLLGQTLELPAFSWWGVLPYALVLLLLLLFVLGYLRGRGGKRPGTDLPAAQPEPLDQFPATVPASNDPRVERPGTRAASE